MYSTQRNSAPRRGRVGLTTVAMTLALLLPATLGALIGRQHLTDDSDPATPTNGAMYSSFVSWYPDTPVASLDSMRTGGFTTDMTNEEKLSILEERWGTHAAGSYIDFESGTPVLNVTGGSITPAMTTMAASIGVRLTPAQFGTDYLRQRLEEWSRSLGQDLESAYVDPVSNRVVLTPVDGHASTVRAAVNRSPEVIVDDVQDADLATAYVTVAKKSKPLLPGGTGMTASNVVCTLGFNALRGTTPVFLTAGHCALDQQRFVVGATPVGAVSAISFPARDAALGQVLPAWQTSSTVRVNRNRSVQVRGMQEAPVGATVCKSGAKTGWTCGRIIAKNVAVRYKLSDNSTVVVHGLTKTDVCTAPGDSGGPWMWGTQAQGLTSGGVTYDGKCGALVGKKTVSYFQPLRPVLDAYGARLLVSP